MSKSAIKSLKPKVGDYYKYNYGSVIEAHNKWIFLRILKIVDDSIRCRILKDEISGQTRDVTYLFTSSFIKIKNKDELMVELL